LAAHNVADADPVNGTKDPGGAAVHVSELISVENVPVGQTAHDNPLIRVPAGQLKAS